VIGAAMEADKNERRVPTPNLLELVRDIGFETTDAFRFRASLE